ncbi:extensin-like domain-containing protein [Chelatococcus reniformis]|uniref:Extensin-like C-terminal domain-containing protein n=1 Tax=Chelatococcus reniformis TaxID=1494448 RepID=A0A916UEK9_9HYPH|nr:extensin family protein [Chelatococcus reniformis]GGC68132.1 hypothetical protein GCM10010994_28380 [Chelatococcus reniformis]
MTFVSTARCPAGSPLRRLSCAALATVLVLSPLTESHRAGAVLAAPSRLPSTGPLPPPRPDGAEGAANTPERSGQLPPAQDPSPGGPAAAAPSRKLVPAWGPVETEDEVDLPGRAPLPPPRPAFRGEPTAPPPPETLPQAAPPLDAQPKAAPAPALPSWWPFGRQTPPGSQDEQSAPAPSEPGSGRRGKRQRVIPSDAEVAQCVARLRRKGAEVDPIAPVANGGCGLPLGVRLSRLPGDLPLSVPAVMTCALAEAVEEWVATVVRPAARGRLGAQPTKVLVGPTYQCRTMNHQPGAKLSEHAFGNAMDVAGFEFDAHATFKVGFKSPRSEDGAFQAEIRSRACGLFDTVLGPGSDPFHSTHLHVDLRNRGPGRHICR